MKSNKRPKKILCEVCGVREPKILQLHHIIPQTDLATSNDWHNLAVICPSCHMLHHSGEIDILGVVESTAEGGRSLIFKQNGKINLDIDIPVRHTVKGSKCR